MWLAHTICDFVLLKHYNINYNYYFSLSNFPNPLGVSTVCTVFFHQVSAQSLSVMLSAWWQQYYSKFTAILHC